MATVTAKPTAPDSLPEFEAAWDQFFAAVRRARGRAAREIGDDGLTLAQYQLLAAFSDRDRDRYRVGELAELGGVSPPSATRMLDGLERDGIVERSPSAEDRRQVTVSLTPEGKRQLARKRRNTVAKRRKMFESLDPSERRRSAELLSRLATVIDKL
jgi:MarR family transcriptional regulator, organic hydroperoxide resistance regulator